MTGIYSIHVVFVKILTTPLQSLTSSDSQMSFFIIFFLNFFSPVSPENGSSHFPGGFWSMPCGGLGLLRRGAAPPSSRRVVFW